MVSWAQKGKGKEITQWGDILLPLCKLTLGPAGTPAARWQFQNQTLSPPRPYPTPFPLRCLEQANSLSQGSGEASGWSILNKQRRPETCSFPSHSILRSLVFCRGQNTRTHGPLQEERGTPKPSQAFLPEAFDFSFRSVLSSPTI